MKKIWNCVAALSFIGYLLFAGAALSCTLFSDFYAGLNETSGNCMLVVSLGASMVIMIRVGYLMVQKHQRNLAY